MSQRKFKAKRTTRAIAAPSLPSEAEWADIYLRDLAKCLGPDRKNRKAGVVEEAFDITCYSDDIAAMIYDEITTIFDMVENRTLSAFIDESADNYVKAMMVLNMGNLKGWLDWGTSIRTAWFGVRFIENGAPPFVCSLGYQAIKRYVAGEDS